MSWQITLPFTFVPNTTIVSAQVNQDLQTLLNAFNSGLGQSFTASGYAILPGGLYVQWGSVTVDADGAAAASATFSQPFPTGLLAKPICGISNNYQTNQWELSAPQTTGETQNGFNVSVAGGPQGSTVTVSYLAVGF